METNVCYQVILIITGCIEPHVLLSNHIQMVTYFFRCFLKTYELSNRAGFQNGLANNASQTGETCWIQLFDKTPSLNITQQNSNTPITIAKYSWDQSFSSSCFEGSTST
jgi:hypothetical protein